MIALLKKLFGLSAKVNYSELIEQGAIILDVRSKAEYLGGHITNSINIPVDTLSNTLFKLKDKNRPIITVVPLECEALQQKNFEIKWVYLCL